jgi:hypothetical protein
MLGDHLDLRVDDACKPWRVLGGTITRSPARQVRRWSPMRMTISPFRIRRASSPT